MGHHHCHQPASYNTAFGIAISANFIFVIVQAFYAWSANSMSLMADAGHNLGDVLGLILAWFSTWLLTQKSPDQFTYGHRKTTILSALANALLLVATAGIIAFESLQKFFLVSHDVDELTMVVVAFLGIIVNGATALLFMRGRHNDLNIKGAFLHLAYDALISLGVVITGILIYYTGYEWLDPLIGLFIVSVILAGTWHLLRDAVNLILDAAPNHIDIDRIQQFLKQLPHVSSFHDLHVWGLSTSETAMTVHLIMPDHGLSDADHFAIQQQLMSDFGIHHVTIQVERGDNDSACQHTATC